MRGRAKIRTNNSNSGKRALNSDEEKMHVFIYQTSPFSFPLPRLSSHFASAYLSISHFSQSKISLLNSLTLRVYLGLFISVFLSCSLPLSFFSSLTFPLPLFLSLFPLSSPISLSSTIPLHMYFTFLL